MNKNIIPYVRCYASDVMKTVSDIYAVEDDIFVRKYQNRYSTPEEERKAAEVGGEGCVGRTNRGEGILAESFYGQKFAPISTIG